MNPDLSLYLLNAGQITQEQHQDNVAKWEAEQEDIAKREQAESERAIWQKKYDAANMSSKKRMLKEQSANLLARSLNEDDSFEKRRLEKKSYNYSRAVRKVSGGSLY